MFMIFNQRKLLLPLFFILGTISIPAIERIPAPPIKVTKRPKYPDKPLPKPVKRKVITSGRVFWDTDHNGKDNGEKGIPGVFVSDGEHVVKTDTNGNYKLDFNLEDPRFVFITRPQGTQPTTSWFFRIPPEESQTKYQINFGLTKDPMSARKDFTFLASADSQFCTASAFAKLKEEFKQITSMSGNPGFLTMTGDLTQYGSEWELDMYKDACKCSRIMMYDVFGGHDALSREKQGIKNIFNYELKIGPAWYSWDYGPVHFIAAVSERSYVSKVQWDRQMHWLEADLAAQPPNTPIILNMHTTVMDGNIRKWKEKYNIIALIYGHYHFNTVTGTEEVPFIVTGPVRHRDWGAFSVVFRVFKYRRGKLSTELRIGCQYNRLEVVSPQGTVPIGKIPVQILAYNTSSWVKNVNCTIQCAGKNNSIQLKKDGAWTWSGVWESPKQKTSSDNCLITVTAFDDQGEKWNLQKQFKLTDVTPILPRLGKSWPSVFGPDGNQRITTDQPSLPMNLLWTIQTGGRNTVTSPIIYQDKVYIGIENSEIDYPETGILCVDALNGKKIWKHKTVASVVSTPLAKNGFIFAVDSLGNCYKFDAETGKKIWHRDIGKRIQTNGHLMIGSPLVMYDNYLYVTGDYIYGHMTVLDADSGKIIRYINGKNYFHSFPVMVKNQLWVPGKGGRLEIFDPVNGKSIKKMRFPTGGKTTAGTYFDKHFFINAPYAHCINTENHKDIWKNKTPSQSVGISLPVARDNMVYYHGGANLFAYGINIGKLIWKVPFIYDIEEAKTNRRQIYGGQSSPLLAGDTLFVGADDGYVYAIEAKTGKVLWCYDLGLPIKSSPIVSGNILFVYDFDGNLYAFAK